MYPATAVLVAAMYVLNAQPTFADDDSSQGDPKRNTTDTVMTWIVFPILGIEFVFLCYLIFGWIYQYLTVKRKVKETYASLTPVEKE